MYFFFPENDYNFIKYFSLKISEDHKLKKAEEYLIAAYWNFLKYTKEDDQAEDGEQGDEGKKDKEEITEE